MNREFNLITLCLSVLSTACSVVVLIAQCVIAGGFRWFQLLLALWVLLQCALTAESWKNHKQNN